jgi:hypothetical protein
VDSETTWLSAALLFIAIDFCSLCSRRTGWSIGLHSGYGFGRFAPLIMKTTALSLKLLVAAIGTVLFLQAFPTGLARTSIGLELQNRELTLETLFERSSEQLDDSRVETSQMRPFLAWGTIWFKLMKLTLRNISARRYVRWSQRMT